MGISLTSRLTVWPKSPPNLASRRGAAGLIFCLALLPLVLVVALAVDYGFYGQARSQLSLANDVAVMQAVNAASFAYQTGATPEQAIAAGQAAGQQWFAAQAGALGTAIVSPNNINVVMDYNQTSNVFTAKVSYSGSVPTHIGGFITPSWPIGDKASAQSGSNYLEVLMLLDNSSSMLIGAGYSDQQLLMQMTPCNTSYYEMY